MRLTLSNQIYAGDRVAYMNARAAIKPASGGKNYARHDRMVNVTAERERIKSLDEFDLLRAKLSAFYYDQRAIVSEFRNRLATGMTANEPIPF